MDFKKLCELFGGVRELSKILGISESNVYAWVSGSKIIPIHHIRKLKKISGIRANQLKNDSEILKEWGET